VLRAGSRGFYFAEMCAAMIVVVVMVSLLDMISQRLRMLLA